MNAIAKVAQESTINHDNGTYGKELLVHYWDSESMFDKDRSELEKQMATMILSGASAQDIIQIRERIELLPKPKLNMVFRLVDPIAKITGTKVINDGQKSFSPVAMNVQFIYISEDMIDRDAITFLETTDSAEDKLGNVTPIISLKLKSCLIDVKEPTTNYRGEMTRGARANITDISYRAMQLSGIVMRTTEDRKRKMYGMEEIA